MTDRFFTRSASEYQRLAEEASYDAACKRVRELRVTLKDLTNPKGVREAALRELRPLEKEFGLDETYPNGYNG